MIRKRGAPLQTIAPTAAAVLLALVALALHPHLTGHAGPQAELRELASLSVRDRLVHGALLLLLGILLSGFASYAQRRGLGRRVVVAGLVSFAVGIGALFAAGIIDGFVLPEIVARFGHAPRAAQDAAITTLVACAVAVNVLTAFGLVAMAIAIAAWSLDLVRDAGACRTAGIVGFAAASLTIAILVMGGPSITPHSLMAVLCVQGVWYVWIAALLASR